MLDGSTEAHPPPDSRPSHETSCLHVGDENARIALKPCANVLQMTVGSNLLIDVSREGDRVVLRLDGELDLASVPLLEDAVVNTTLNDGGGGAELTMVLDLRGLEFIDSTGLRAILLQDKRATERGQKLALVRGSEQVQRLMRMTGVDEHLRIIDSPEEILL
jgi:anti-sigma B factor antagonist